MHIEIFSDFLSPWCYIAKRRLEKAVSALKGRVDVSIDWRAFESNPQAPATGVSRRIERAARFGSENRAEASDVLVAEAGRAEGIEFAFEKIERTPNTFDAHRLIELARKENRQDAVVEGLFRGYFVEGGDLTQRETLIDIASRAALDPALTESYLQTDQGKAEVRADEARGRTLGIKIVPYFVIDDVITLPWALDAATIGRAIEQASGSPILSANKPEDERHGFARTRCGCTLCQSYCKHVPGRLDVQDLLRLCPQGADVFAWAERHLEAVTDQAYPKLVPARRANGHCQWFQDGGCMVHAVAPFGCAYFDAHMTPEEVQRRGLATSRACLDDAQHHGLYTQVWRHLRDRGLTRPSGNRARLDEEMELIYLSIDQVNSQ
jgi:predicted DsbA family dithiol-disulfide isomerase